MFLQLNLVGANHVVRVRRNDLLWRILCEENDEGTPAENIELFKKIFSEPNLFKRFSVWARMKTK
eukprot:snap_masked-scaffold_22-processed-gene-1.10-mRNA-1 protein AED:1.00 eAED:1.00 QI:0/-1/0/0/-1/1/1/0/64